MKKLTFILLGCISALLISSQSFAETTMSQEGQYIFNSLGFYLGGVLVAFMAAGFCMLESGLVTTKSVSTIAAKNIGKFAICSLVFFLVGYNLAYGVPEGGYVGSFTIWTGSFKRCSCVQQLQSCLEQWQRELRSGHSLFLQQLWQE